ncbi:Uncharacterized protein Adt_06116 [Abeliophyllum distichum]|uniref:Uncharacterized protein n=1 Tax=Abeliophyllum distichum TaxID=126358 RepID=A0ABD1V606_9LAMI
MLRTCEVRIQHNNQVIPNATANVASRQHNFYGTQGRENPSNPQGRGCGKHSAICGSGRGNFNPTYHSNNYPNTLLCQLCDKPGHTAIYFFKRFELNYLPPPPRLTLQANFASNQPFQHQTDQD